MKHCGVVTDRSWYKARVDKGEILYGQSLWEMSDDNPRIYTDEAPMADTPMCLRNVCFYEESEKTRIAREELQNKIRLNRWEMLV